MKRHMSQIGLLLAGLQIAGLSVSVSAAEMRHDILVRNALDRPVRFAITRTNFVESIKESVVRARWEMTLKSVKVEDLSNNVSLGVQVRNAESSQVGTEITRCQSTLSKSSIDPQIAVIIHKLNDEESPRCDIVDLHALQAVATTQTPVAPENRLASKN